MSGSLVLEEYDTDEYQPTEREVREYGDYLGIDFDREPHLIWIAREGIMAPLPLDWKPCQSPEGEIYYFNFKTGESKWDHPSDELYKKMVIDERKKYQQGTTGGPKADVKKTNNQETGAEARQTKVENNQTRASHDVASKSSGKPVESITRKISTLSTKPVNSTDTRKSVNSTDTREPDCPVEDLSTKPVASSDAKLTSTKSKKPVESAKAFCDLCIHDNKRIEATAFCRDCRQYLCEYCNKIHGRGAVTKRHSVLTGKSLPIKGGKKSK